MKVLYLVPPAKRPGQLTRFTFLEEEIHGLADAGVEACVLTTSQSARSSHPRVRVRRLPPGHAPARVSAFLLRHGLGLPRGTLIHARQLYRAAAIEEFASAVVCEEGIDLIHSHFGWPSGVGGLLARRETNRPLLACLRGMDILVNPELGYGRRASPFYDRMIRRLLRSADRTLYFSDFMRERALQLGARPACARVVTKGVNLEQFGHVDGAEGLRAELDLDGTPIILTVAGLIPLKGIDHILHALARLAERHPFVFIVCGAGPERENLQALSRRLGLQDRTRFMGWVERDRIARFFAACDVFVLGSLVEAAGNVVLEAMAAGRPVVCTASGGPLEYVEDGCTGFVVAPGDHAALATRLDLLLGQPELRERLGREGQRRAGRHLGYARMIRDIVALYDDMLRERADVAVRSRSAIQTER